MLAAVVSKAEISLPLPLKQISSYQSIEEGLSQTKQSFSRGKCGITFGYLWKSWANKFSSNCTLSSFTLELQKGSLAHPLCIETVTWDRETQGLGEVFMAARWCQLCPLTGLYRIICVYSMVAPFQSLSSEKVSPYSFL
jgi:hypothetical protein